jgi:hypothetical protein
MCNPPTLLFEAKDRGDTQSTRTLAAANRRRESLDLNDVSKTCGRELSHLLKLALTVGIVGGRLFNRFRNLAWASRERTEWITENDIFPLREHLDGGFRLSSEEFAECRVVPLHKLIEAIHSGSLPQLQAILTDARRSLVERGRQ